MSRRTLILLAAGGSAALLLGALAFQYIGGLPPCKLCYWQRYPHVAAALAGPLALWLRGPLMPALGGLAALSTAGVGVYHTGVERDWWEGPTTCTSGDIGTLSSDALFDQIMAAPVIQCDQVTWEMLGLSMASWNALLSLALAALWTAAIARSLR